MPHPIGIPRSGGFGYFADGFAFRTLLRGFGAAGTLGWAVCYPYLRCVLQIYAFPPQYLYISYVSTLMGFPTIQPISNSRRKKHSSLKIPLGWPLIQSTYATARSYVTLILF